MECRWENKALPHVVIVGAGFGGLYAARAFKDVPFLVTVIDRHNHHVFQPLLYQVATAGLSPSDITCPIRSILRRYRNTRVFQNEVIAIKPHDRKVVLQDGELHYDYLILSAGARHSYYGHPEWEAYAPGLKSVADALNIRNRILGAFEKAEREPKEERRRELLTFVIVGGGPTGVELAGAIAEIAFNVMVQDFRMIDPRETRILLIQAPPRVLMGYPEDLSAKTERSLNRLGVEVRTNARVTAIQPGMVMIGDQQVPSGTILWAAGATASPLARSLGVPLDHAGRVLVEPDLSAPSLPEIFVIGDLAGFVDQRGHLLPSLAPIAIQQGRHAARNVLFLSEGKPTKPFRYKNRGQMAAVGRGAAVAEFRGLGISGLPAWVAWLFIHIYSLIGFRNRFFVLLKWIWAFGTFHNAARVIIDEPGKMPPISGTRVC